MKKLLSIFLAAIMVFLAAAQLAPVLQVNADTNPCVVYAYKSDGTRTAFSDAMPEGITLEYNNGLFHDGKRFVKLTVTPAFTDTYKAIHIAVANFADMAEIYVQGTVNLSAVKMIYSDGEYYSALSCNKELRIFPASDDAKLYLSGAYKQDELDAPYMLVRSPSTVSVYSDKETGRRMTLQTYFDMRYAKEAKGHKISVASKELALYSATLKCTARSVILMSSDTKLYLHGTAVLDSEFNGSATKVGSEYTSESQTFDCVYFTDDFTGAVYSMMYYGGAYKVNYGKNTLRHSHVRSSDGATLRYATFATLAPAAGDVSANLTPITEADIKAAFDSGVDYRLGNTLPAVVNAKGFVAELKWLRMPDGEDRTGKEIESNKGNVATVHLCPVAGYTWDDSALSAAAKPETALSVSLTTDTENVYNMNLIVFVYPAIDPAKAPVITQQPEAQTYYTNSGAAVTYTVKAENAVSYQWHAVRTDKIDLKLTDDDVYQGATTNTLRVKKVSDAIMVKEFYCVVSAPLFQDVVSDHAALNRVSRVNSVTVNNLDSIKAGPYSGRDTTFNISFDPPFAVTHTQSVEYRDYATNGIPVAFSEGDKIKVTVTVEITQDGFEFQHDGLVGIWNDQMVAAVFPEAGNYRLATFTFTAIVGADENAILFADLKAKIPGIGASRSDFGFDIVASDPKFFVAGITVSPFTQYVNANTDYTVNFTLLANSGCYFTEDTRFSVDGEPLEATLSNGNRVAALVYNFTTPGMEIEMAEIFANVPKVGEPLDPSKNTVETTGAEKDRFALSGTWDVERDKDNKVTADYTRALNFTLNAKDGYRFTPSTVFVVHYKNNDGSDAALLLNNELTADADVVDLLAFFDEYPAIHEHVPYTVYQLNETQHQYACKYCHEMIKEDHTPGDWIVDTPATVTAEGSKHKECVKCKYVLETAKIEKLKDDEPAFLLGDVDGSGKVDTADARLALRQSIGLEHYTAGSREFKACDVDKNGKVETKDARYILRKGIGLPNTDIGW